MLIFFCLLFTSYVFPCATSLKSYMFSLSKDNNDNSDVIMMINTIENVPKTDSFL